MLVVALFADNFSVVMQWTNKNARNSIMEIETYKKYC